MMTARASSTTRRARPRRGSPMPSRPRSASSMRRCPTSAVRCSSASPPSSLLPPTPCGPVPVPTGRTSPCCAPVRLHEPPARRRHDVAGLPCRRGVARRGDPSRHRRRAMDVLPVRPLTRRRRRGIDHAAHGGDAGPRRARRRGHRRSARCARRVADPCFRRPARGQQIAERVGLPRLGIRGGGELATDVERGDLADGDRQGEHDGEARDSVTSRSRSSRLSAASRDGLAVSSRYAARRDGALGERPLQRVEVVVQRRQLGAEVGGRSAQVAGAARSPPEVVGDRGEVVAHALDGDGETVGGVVVRPDRQSRPTPRAPRRRRRRRRRGCRARRRPGRATARCPR